ncbi:hypothetical protein [Haloactinopolyspora sp.]|uniref:hypothetical protein n=1 Tax=Haloactinopolyspora sp. TaxID=1966353 RepID=UPI00262C59B9|nr:hypothetical protein [Haloactinopolyspora sp.]
MTFVSARQPLDEDELLGCIVESPNPHECHACVVPSIGLPLGVTSLGKNACGVNAVLITADVIIDVHLRTASADKNARFLQLGTCFQSLGEGCGHCCASSRHG